MQGLYKSCGDRLLAERNLDAILASSAASDDAVFENRGTDISQFETKECMLENTLLHHLECFLCQCPLGVNY